jgi:Cid1 family poly A polymerase
MIINFLQTRDPPILPALQQGPFLQPKFMSGLNVAFNKNVFLYRGYGSHNKDSLGVLLFQFFRYYGHEIDFETSVMSVRAGKVITKLEKNWHFLQDNRLCVEEPFNNSRNLGNTADDTSVRGIHLELRRAFEMVSEANLAKCCDEYVPPANLIDAPRPLERQRVSANRPTLAHSAATIARAGRGSSRGGRQNQQLHRSPNSGRRASSASTRGNAYPQPLSLGTNLTQTELSLQAQHQQHLLHDRLYQQYQFLQAQEQELRAQLHQQAVLQGRMLPIAPYPHFLFPFGAYAGGQEELIRARAGLISQPPLTAPIRPHGFSFSTYGGRSPGFGSTTNPPSPSLHSVIPDSRRSYRRSSMTNGSSGASMRAQSQPPRPVPSPLSFRSMAEKRPEYSPRLRYNPGEDLAPTSSRVQEFVDAVAGAQGRLYQSLGTDRTGSEYIGYYLGHSPPLPTYSRSVIGSPLTCSSTGLGIQSGGISPQVLAQLPSSQLSIPPSSSEPSRSPSTELGMPKTVALEDLTFQEAYRPAYNLSRPSSNPVVVNGSANWEIERRQSIIDLHGSLNTTNFDTSASDDIAVETPSSSDDCSQGIPEARNADNESIPVRDVLTTRIEPSRRQKGPRRFPRQVHDSLDLAVAGTQSKFSVVPISAENERPTVNGATRTPEHNTVSGAEGSPFGKEQVHSKAFQLSPVKEVRTPTPTKSRPFLGPEESAQGLSKQRTKVKAKPKKSALSSVDQGEDKAETLVSQPNGLAAVHRPQQSSNMGSVPGWQTQKKKSKHKKGSKSETDLKAVNPAGGDFLPLDESLRKGG